MVRSKEKKEKVVYSSDAEGNLLVWVCKKRKPKLKQKAKIAQYIGSMILFNKNLCIGTEKNVLLVDQHVRVYLSLSQDTNPLKNLEVIRQWKGHTREITGLVEYNKEIWSASGDSTIRVWSEEVSCNCSSMGFLTYCRMIIAYVP